MHNKKIYDMQIKFRWISFALKHELQFLKIKQTLSSNFFYFKPTLIK